MGGNFGRDRDSKIPGPCFSRARMYGSWVADGEAYQTPPAIMQHIGWRQTRSGRFAVVVSQDAAESLAALDLTGVLLPEIDPAGKH